MSPNRKKLKRRIKPLKRYEGYVSTINKRNDSDIKTSNDENSTDDIGNKGMKDVKCVWIKMGWKQRKLMRVGRTDYASVLVEIEANKELKVVIKIEYIGENEAVKGTKDVSMMKRYVQNQKWNWQKKVNNMERNTHEFRQRNMGKGANSNDWSQNVKNKGSKPPRNARDVNKFNVLNEENLDKTSNWSKDMIKYFKDQWEIDRLKEQEDQDKNMEDVYENKEGTGNGSQMISNDISPLNSQNSILKKLDRVVVNEELTMKFPKANALFLPYLISDHSLIAGWNAKVYGCKIFKLVKKMKGLKSRLKALSWKNRNLHEKVKNCKKKFKEAQTNLDDNPHNHKIKRKEAMALEEYNEAIRDEENLLFQKAKVDWISKASKDVNDIKDFDRVFGIKLSKYEAMVMVRDITDIEIKNAMFNIGIKHGLHKLVDLNRSAFIQGRVIQDNILIAQELLKGYYRKNGPSRRCFKIDIAKAYDNVDWNFLEKCLNHFGFHNKIGRGLRQGDLIGCKDNRVTNMCFASDLLVVCHGDVDLVKTVKVTMVEFSEISKGKNTLWVKWVNVVKFQGRSIWEIQKEYNDSWMWKTLLDLRSKVSKDIYDARLAGNMSVLEMISDNKWIWPDVWILKYPNLANFSVSTLNQQEKDITKWKDANGNLINFSSKAAWEDNLVEQYAYSVCNKSIGSILMRIVLVSTVYHIWKERNARLFTSELVDDKTMIKIITDNIKLQLIGLKVKRSPNMKKVVMEWNILMNYK
ncbi:RNA-directed DNA polymerase, eukaryota, reverse transcriptase zinc-binding domain protein [Tanacetum coccineum]|uniref:RNA-directed DNA polymerase, eukaryota, reverse transcriptase zinc-binding domain protein n=1 Tax=Tanacetum coccineum TaxID=301880 RepID=A0ABQ5F9M3_9ASTR